MRSNRFETEGVNDASNVRSFTAGWRTPPRGALSRAYGQQGQGTVEYVGLILLVAALMGGMVAAVGGQGSLSGIGKELAETITTKITPGGPGSRS